MLLFKSLNRRILASCSQTEPCVDFAHLCSSSCCLSLYLLPEFISFPLAPIAIPISTYFLGYIALISPKSTDLLTHSLKTVSCQPQLELATQVQVFFFPPQTLDPTKPRYRVNHELIFCLKGFTPKSPFPFVFLLPKFERGALRRDPFP